MKKTKTLRILLPALALATITGLGISTVGAQTGAPGDDVAVETERGQRGDRPTAEERVDRRLQHLDRRLDLSDDQEAQIRAIMDQAQAEREAMREARRRARAEHEAAIDAVLTPEQQAEFDAMKEQRREQRNGHARGRGHGHGHGRGNGHARGHGNGPHADCPPNG